MLKTLLTTLLFLLAFNIYSAPVVYDPLYKIELLTTVTGSALHAMDISSNGRLFVSSYNDGKVFVLDSPAASGAQTAIEYASGFVNANGLAFADDGRLFASTSFGSIYQVFNNGTSSLFSSGHANSTSLGVCRV